MSCCHTEMKRETLEKTGGFVTIFNGLGGRRLHLGFVPPHSLRIGLMHVVSC